MLGGTVSILSTLPARAEPPSESPPSSAADERAFEVDAARYERLAALTRKLSEAAAADAEREFDAEVELYVRKRELTRELSARNATSGRFPSTTPAPTVPASASPTTASAAPVW